MTEVIDSSVAYFVRNEHDSTVLLALDVKHHDGIIEWHDTQRDQLQCGHLGVREGRAVGASGAII